MFSTLLKIKFSSDNRRILVRVKVFHLKTNLCMEEENANISFMVFVRVSLMFFIWGEWKILHKILPCSANQTIKFFVLLKRAGLHFKSQEKWFESKQLKSDWSALWRNFFSLFDQLGRNLCFTQFPHPESFSFFFPSLESGL